MYDEYSGNLLKISYWELVSNVSMLINGTLSISISDFFEAFSFRFAIGFPLFFISFCGIVILLLSEFKFYKKKWFYISSAIIMPLLIFVGVDSLYYDDIKTRDILLCVLPTCLALCCFYILFYRFKSDRGRNKAKEILISINIFLLLIMIPEVISVTLGGDITYITSNSGRFTFFVTFSAALICAVLNILHTRKLELHTKRS